MKLYTSKEMSNSRYHSDEFPQASGSKLAVIVESTPAEFMYGERKETKALIDGTGLHVCVLEPALFKQSHERGIDPADYPDALVTNKDLEAWLKSQGIGKTSGKVKDELLAMIDATGESPPILQRIMASHAQENADKVILSPESFDMVIKMRSAMKKLGGYVFTKEMQFEVSLITDLLKCRIDILVPPGEMAPDGVISKNGEIWDLKSTRSVKPDLFGLDSFRRFYYLKMAIQADMFEQFYGHKPDRVVLLAQSKTVPYLPQAYYLTEQQLEAGRADYQMALAVYEECKKTGNWYGYGGGVLPLETPGAAKFMYGIEDEMEIVEVE